MSIVPYLSSDDDMIEIDGVIVVPPVGGQIPGTGNKKSAIAGERK